MISGAYFYQPYCLQNSEFLSFQGFNKLPMVVSVPLGYHTLLCLWCFSPLVTRRAWVALTTAMHISEFLHILYENSQQKRTTTEEEEEVTATPSGILIECYHAFLNRDCERSELVNIDFMKQFDWRGQPKPKRGPLSPWHCGDINPNCFHLPRLTTHAGHNVSLSSQSLPSVEWESEGVGIPIRNYRITQWL